MWDKFKLPRLVIAIYADSNKLQLFIRLSRHVHAARFSERLNAILRLHWLDAALKLPNDTAWQMPT